MAQDITLIGASYSAVPAVTLPKTGGGTATFTDTSDADATASDIASGKTAYVNGSKLTGSASGGGNWVLIGSKELSLLETTSTSASETDTGIDVSGTDYAWILVVITCTGTPTSNNEWGMTVDLIGRSMTSGRVFASNAAEQRGVQSLSYADMPVSTSIVNYGVTVKSNVGKIVIVRKCDSSHINKIRGGTYTVKVYGMTGF